MATVPASLDDAPSADPLRGLLSSLPPEDQLRSGMRIGYREFLRRREAVRPALERQGRSATIERIGGTVRIMFPADYEFHAMPQGDLIFLFVLYRSRTPGVISAGPGTLDIDDLGVTVEPDASLAISPEHGGQLRRDDDGRIAGVPELVVEIANTSEAYDLGAKREAYEAAGVREYLVHAVRSKRFHAFRREGAALAAVSLDDGVFVSRAFPGLRIDCDALLGGELAEAIATLEAGCGTKAHREFIDRLETR